MVERGLGKNGNTGRIIKSFRLFYPHDEDHVKALPKTPGVYLLYAGNNDVAIPSEAIPGGEVSAIDRLRIVGTPEYIGQTDNIRRRINDRKYAHRRGDKESWWFREGWINLAVYVETDMALREELETLLIGLLSPQINKSNAWLYEKDWKSS